MGFRRGMEEGCTGSTHSEQEVGDLLSPPSPPQSRETEVGRGRLRILVGVLSSEEGRGGWTMEDTGFGQWL